MDQIHPEDRDRVVASIQAALNSGADRWKEKFRYCLASGSYNEVIDRAYIVRDENGKAERMLGAMLNISLLEESQP